MFFTSYTWLRKNKNLTQWSHLFVSKSSSKGSNQIGVWRLFIQRTKERFAQRPEWKGSKRILLSTDAGVWLRVVPTKLLPERLRRRHASWRWQCTLPSWNSVVGCSADAWPHCAFAARMAECYNPPHCHRQTIELWLSVPPVMESWKIAKQTIVKPEPRTLTGKRKTHMVLVF